MAPLRVNAASGSIRLYRSWTGSDEITQSANNVFTGSELTRGVDVFAEGVSVCAVADDIQLVLELSPGAPPTGIPGSTRLTAVKLSLDVGRARTAAGVDPVLMSAADKVNPGRFVHLQDTGFHHGRAQLLVRPVQPAGFACTVNIVAVDARVGLFTSETGATGAVTTPFEILSGLILNSGMEFFAEGQGVSGGLRDTGVRLELDGQEGDRIAMTVMRFSNLTADIPSTPARTPRMGNSPVARHKAVRGTSASLTPADYDVSFTANPPLVLLEGSVLPADPVNLIVTVTPVGVPVSWDVRRDTRPSPSGDHPSIVALSPNPRPTLTPNGADPLRATLVTDAVGSFHVRAFVDTNGNGRFDPAGREPFLLLNLVLVRVSLFQDSSRTPGAFSQGQVVVKGQSIPGSIAVLSGASVKNPMANPSTAAIHMSAMAALIGGGDDGARGLDRVFAGWINNELDEDVVATFEDASVNPPVNPRSINIFASNKASATGPNNEFVKGQNEPNPVTVLPPFLDSTRNPVGVGGGTACLLTSRISSRTKLRTNATPSAIGQRLHIEAVDSPNQVVAPLHPRFSAAQLVHFQFNLDFRAFLCFWTSTSMGANRLYVVLHQFDWTIRGKWTIIPSTGAIKAETPFPITQIVPQSPLTHSPAATAESRGVEARTPTAIDVLTQDSRF